MGGPRASGGCSPVASVPTEQGAQRDAEGFRDLGEAEDRDIAHAALDPGHVGPVDPGLVGKRFLRPAFLLPEAADPGAEGLEEGMERLPHAPMLGRCGL